MADIGAVNAAPRFNRAAALNADQPAPAAGAPAAFVPAAAADDFQAAGAMNTTQLWNLYQPGVPKPTGRTAERALGVLAGLTPYLAELKSNPTSAAESDMRTPLFSGEALFRMYKDTFPQLGQGESGMKSLEDAIGAYHQPSTVKEHEAAVQRLTSLVKSDWAPNAQGKSPVIERIINTLAKTNLGNDDTALMKKAVYKQIRDVGEKKFDMGQLQGREGIHELRRQVRWISYYNQLANTGGAPMNLVPKSMMDAVSLVHSGLGDIKDRGEEAEKLARQKVEDSGGAINYHQALEQVEKELGPKYAMATLKAEGQKIYDQFKTVYASIKDKLV